MLHLALWRNQCAILVYHAVIRSPLTIGNWCFLDESSFRSQMNYLRRHFEVVHLLEAVGRMQEGKMDRPIAVITFDDGFQNNYDVAFPILREAGLPATIFLSTGLVNTSNTVWFCHLNRALASTGKRSLDWNGSRFDLSGPHPKKEASVAIQNRLKEFAHPQLLAELRKIILELGQDPHCPIEADSPYRMLSKEAITEMANSELIEFGAHTHTHSILSRLSQKQQRDEIERSVTEIGEMTGRPCQLFAYPNGSAQDYDAESIQTLVACGVRAAVTTIVGPNDKMTPAMELRRYGIGPDESIALFQLKVHHFLSLVRRIFREHLRIRKPIVPSTRLCA